jgi:hypothetical protein
MKSTANHSPRAVRLGPTAILFALNLCAATAWAGCDPNNIKHAPCPAPKPAHSTLVSHNYLGPKPAGSTKVPHRPPTYTAEKKPVIGPVSPGPLHATQSAAAPSSNTHRIIFVGGKPTNNKAALNPQPIPPGTPGGPLEHSH